MSIDVLDYRSSDVSKLFSQSLKQTGFAVLRDHPLKKERIDRIYENWLHFFNSEEKHRYAFDPKTHAGFISTARSETAKGSRVKDLKEFFHYYQGKVCPPSLFNQTDELFNSMKQLAQELLGWVEQGLPQTIQRGLSEPLKDMIVGSEDTLLRVIHYPPMTERVPAGAIRAAAHEDINLLTVLPAATAKGLQIMTQQGDWIDVPCESGWLIINIGDMLQECTQGFYRSTSHRVINPSPEFAALPRVSCPLFLHPRGEVVLSERHTAESYRQERFAELGLAS